MNPTWIRERLAPPLAIFLLTMLVAISLQQSDAAYYTADIISVRAGAWTKPFHPLWEFGHLLLRPTGFALSQVADQVIPSGWGWTEYMRVYGCLVAVSTVASGGIVWLLHDMGWLLGLRGWPLALLTVGLCWGNAFLSCAKGAHAYMASLLFLTLAVYLQVRWVAAGKTKLSAGGFAAVAGSIALSGLWWFPMVLAAPAVALIPVLVQSRRRWREAFLLLTVAGFAVAAGELAGAWLAGIRDTKQLAVWITSTNQHRQSKLWLRAITGVSRLMLHPGTSNIVMKRYLFHDPYNPAALWEVLLGTGGRLAAFYLFGAITMALTWVNKEARGWLALLGAAFLPMLLFAVTLFEPSSLERFLCVLPFLFAALAVGWQGRAPYSAACRAALAVFLAIVLLVNAPEMAPAISSGEQRLQTQLREYRENAQPGDLAVTVVSEPLLAAAETRPFDPLNHGAPIAAHQLLLPNSVQVETWQRYFARRVQATWEAGHEVWFLSSALAGRPEKASEWVEGDDARISWAKVRAFTGLLQFDAPKGGYVKLARSSQNEAMIAKWAE